MNPPLLSTTRRIKRIAPLQLGKTLAILYGAMGLLFRLVLSITTAVMPHLPEPPRGLFAFIGAVTALIISALIPAWPSSLA